MTTSYNVYSRLGLPLAIVHWFIFLLFLTSWQFQLSFDWSDRCSGKKLVFNSTQSNDKIGATETILYSCESIVVFCCWYFGPSEKKERKEKQNSICTWANSNNEIYLIEMLTKCKNRSLKPVSSVCSNLGSDTRESRQTPKATCWRHMQKNRLKRMIEQRNI